MKKYKNIISKFRKHQFSTFAIFHSARTYIDLINVKLYIVYLSYFSQDILQIHAVYSMLEIVFVVTVVLEDGF